MSSPVLDAGAADGKGKPVLTLEETEAGGGTSQTHHYYLVGAEGTDGLLAKELSASMQGALLEDGIADPEAALRDLKCLLVPQPRRSPGAPPRSLREAKGPEGIKMETVTKGVAGSEGFSVDQARPGRLPSVLPSLWDRDDMESTVWLVAFPPREAMIPVSLTPRLDTFNCYRTRALTIFLIWKEESPDGFHT